MTTASAVISNRPFAGLFDLPANGPSREHGTCFGNEYIGGCGGIGWYQYYIDAKTGEVYSVNCTDGVNGGRGPRSGPDEEWLGRCYYEIFSRCHREADSGKTEIRISRNERAVMQGMTHVVWLESEPGKHDGEQSKEGLCGGLVGYCHGVPVICDLEKEDELPPRISEMTVKWALASVTATPSHRYAKEGEVFIGDYQIPIMSSNIPWKTKRLGPTDRDARGRLGSHLPIFIQKSELDEAIEALRKWEARNT